MGDSKGGGSHLNPLATMLIPQIKSIIQKSDCGIKVPRINVENGIKLGFLFE
jgi:hypothetical protein